MATSEPYEIVRDLLRLRRWAVGVLSSGTDPLPDISGIPHETWRLFLALERCAAVLLERVADQTDRVDQFAIGELRKVAATELQSRMGARIDGRDLALVAARLSFPVTILKGGVNAISGTGPTVPLGDLDILVPHEHVDAMVELLVSAGFGNPAKEGRRHQSLSAAPERMTIEVHWTTHDDGTPLESEVWSRTVPMETAAPLRKLGLTDHIVHLIEHAIDIHRERSVSLRDAILIGDAASQCSPADLDSVRQQIAFNKSMSSLLEFAISLGSEKPAQDPFFSSCANFYSIVVLSDGLPRLLATQGALAFVTGFQYGGMPRANTIRRTLDWRGTGFRPFSGIATRFPRIGHFVVSPLRLAWYSVAAAVTIPKIRRTRRKALSSLELQTR